jgi:signal transduction protein with GAF and PtsI domain
MMNNTLAFARIAAEGAAAPGPEEALWAITRTVPALLGDPAAALRPNAFREEPAPRIGAAATVFLRMPDGRHHLISAPVNFAPSQHYELVAIELGHPGHVAKTRQPMLLHDTALHASFVKILQSFRAGSSMFAPLLWQGEYLGVLICANAARGTYAEADLAALQGFAGLGAALFMAHDGPAWLAGMDVSGRPVRSVGS